MNNFKKCGTFDSAPVLEELQNIIFWNWLNLRRANGLNHQSVDDIILRFQEVQGCHDLMEYFDEMKCVDYFTRFYLPQTSWAVNEFAEGRSIGRIVVAKLKSGGVIDTHIDEGKYTESHDRFHLVVETNTDVTFKCEEEICHFPEGDIWWLANKRPHSVCNLGDTDRIHVIVDLEN